MLLTYGANITNLRLIPAYPYEQQEFQDRFYLVNSFNERSIKGDHSEEKDISKASVKDFSIDPDVLGMDGRLPKMEENDSM